MSEDSVTIGKAIKILRGFHQKDCYSDTPLKLAIPFIINYIRDVEQQLKDKDELLEKIKKMSEEYCSSKFIIQTYRLLHNDEERKILESNKED